MHSFGRQSSLHFQIIALKCLNINDEYSTDHRSRIHNYCVIIKTTGEAIGFADIYHIGVLMRLEIHDSDPI